MDWRKLTQNKPLTYSLAGLLSSFVVAAFLYLSMPVLKEVNQSFVVKEFKTIGVMGTYRKHYHHFFSEIEKLANADQREQSLLRNLASVTRDLELERSRNAERTGEVETQKIAEHLKVEAGSSLAKTPDSIHYQVPDHISSHQLLTLGMEYFRKKDFEKSAVILHELMNLKDDTSLQTPDHFLAAAISWYKMNHFEMASDYLKRTEKSSKPGSVTLKQAMLWEAIVEHSRGNPAQSQRAITRLISLYPQSEEASWINHQRMPASLETKKNEEEHHESEPVAHPKADHSETHGGHHD